MNILNRTKKVFKHNRDVIRRMRPVAKISYEYWKNTESLANYATVFLDEKNPGYMLLKGLLQEAELIVTENRYHDMKEVHLSNFIKKVLFIPKEEQLNEYVGRIKVIRKFFNELEAWKRNMIELEHRESIGEIIIDRGK